MVGTLCDRLVEATGTAVDLALLAVSEDGQVMTHALPASGAVVVGRDPSCSIVLDAARVSREHARIALGPAPTLEDLGSTNGTRLQGRSLEPWTPVPLHPGSAIEVGSLLLFVQRCGDADPARPRASAVGTASEPRSCGIVLLDPVMVALHRVVERVARGDVAVLLQGETGTGKELIAEALHRGSSRVDRPLLRLNCAAFAEALLESELFGRAGVIESAAGGTVLLDDVGELPFAIQARLLRVIEERRVMQVGAVEPRPVDVRFVSATTRDLEAEVARGRFRQDLFNRLNGATLRVPPLRERRLEIEPLAVRFAAHAARALGHLAQPHVSPDALDWLHRHEWPGNVRELRNVMERAVLLATDGVIRPEHLHVTGMTQNLTLSAVGEVDEELHRVQSALARCNGNQTRAAKLLGCARSTLVRKLDAFGLPRPRK